MPAPSVVWPELIIGKEHSRLVVNRFDCAVRRPFKVSLGGEMNMLSAVAGTLIVLSIGILVAHALEVFRSR